MMQTKSYIDFIWRKETNKFKVIGIFNSEFEEGKMTAEELWKKSGLTESYESWSFGDVPDELAALVKKR